MDRTTIPDRSSLSTTPTSPIAACSAGAFLTVRSNFLSCLEQIYLEYAVPVVEMVVQERLVAFSDSFAYPVWLKNTINI